MLQPTSYVSPDKARTCVIYAYKVGIYTMCVVFARTLTLFNQVFNKNLVIVMLKSAAGGQACGRAGVNFWFPLNNFSLF